MSTKNSYQQKFEAQLNEWKAEISTLKAKADKADAQARIEMNKNIDKLRKKRDDLQNKLEQFKKAGEDGWKDLKEGLDSAGKTLTQALSSAKSKFD